MNTSVFKSKKFISAALAALTNLLVFLVSEFGFNLDIEKTISLMTSLSVPFLIYIGAEGYSEARAKQAIEENKIRKISGE
jgi:arginine exporter protein ArgO